MPRPPKFPGRSTLLQFVVAGVVLCGVYLLFGPAIVDWYRGPAQSTAPSEGSASGGRPVDGEAVRDSVYVPTGLVVAEGFEIVRGNCTTCHSAQLITQARATREGWTEMIRWMQATQGLHDLGVHEPIILDYLAKYYAPREVGRRPGLDVAAMEWYLLDLEADR